MKQTYYRRQYIKANSVCMAEKTEMHDQFFIQIVLIHIEYPFRNVSKFWGHFVKEQNITWLLFISKGSYPLFLSHHLTKFKYPSQKICNSQILSVYKGDGDVSRKKASTVYKLYRPLLETGDILRDWLQRHQPPVKYIYLKLYKHICAPITFLHYFY